jgi:hypothetical protein
MPEFQENRQLQIRLKCTEAIQIGVMKFINNEQFIVVVGAGKLVHIPVNNFFECYDLVV